MKNLKETLIWFAMTTLLLLVGCDDSTGTSGQQTVSGKEVAITSPSAGTSAKLGDNITVTATTGEAGAIVSCWCSDLPVGIDTVAPYEFIVPAMTVGADTIEVVAAWPDGTEATDTVVITVTEEGGDTGTDPSITITSPANGSSVVENSTMTMTFSLANYDETKHQISPLLDGFGLMLYPVAADSNGLQLSLNGLDVGVHTFVLSIDDMNTYMSLAKDTLTFTVTEGTGKKIAFMTTENPFNKYASVEKSLPVKIDSYNGASQTVSVTANGEALYFNPYSIDANGMFEFPFHDTMSIGQHSLEVTLLKQGTVVGSDTLLVNILDTVILDSLKPAEGNWVEVHKPMTFTVEALHNCQGVNVYVEEVLIGKATYDISTDSSTFYTLIVDAFSIEAGYDKKVRYEAISAAGNLFSTSVTVTFVDRAPSVSLGTFPSQDADVKVFATTDTVHFSCTYSNEPDGYNFDALIDGTISVPKKESGLDPGVYYPDFFAYKKEASSYGVGSHQLIVTVTDSDDMFINADTLNFVVQ